MPPRTSRRRPGCRWCAGCLASAGTNRTGGPGCSPPRAGARSTRPGAGRGGRPPRWTTLSRVIPSAPDAADLALHNLATQRAIALVSALPPLQAEVIMLRVVAGLDTEAVAELLGRSPGAVRVAAHCGLRRLAGILANAGVTL